MQKFLESIWAKIIRLVLTASAVVMESIPGSYLKEFALTDANGNMNENAVEKIYTTYFNFSGNGLMDWAPLICYILSAAAVIVAVVALFKETEAVLLWLTRLLCFALVAQAVILIFLAPTTWGWCIACVQLIAVALTAVQEMKLEDKNRNK